MKSRMENFRRGKLELPGNLAEVRVGIRGKPYLQELLDPLKEVGVEIIYQIIGHKFPAKTFRSLLQLYQQITIP